MSGRRGDNVNILILSDLHNQKEFPLVEEIDLLLLLGDIPWQTVAKIDEAYDCQKFGVLGNHDRWDTYRNTNIQNIHAVVVEWNGLKIAGFGGAPRYNWKEDGQYEEDECALFMHSLEKVDLFLAHSNPAFQSTNGNREGHRGFESFGRYIKEKQPKLFFHGHLHERYEKQYKETVIHSVYLSKKMSIVEKR